MGEIFIRLCVIRGFRVHLQFESKNKKMGIMSNLDTKLRIGLIEPNDNIANVVKSLFETHSVEVERIKNRKELFQKIENDSINTLVINIFNYGVSPGIEIIEDIPKKEKSIPVCILGTGEQLANFESVPKEWKKKFKSYCKVVIDDSSQNLNENIKQMNQSLFICRKTMIRKKELSEKDTSKMTEEEKKIHQMAEEANNTEIKLGKEANTNFDNSFISGVSGQALPIVIRKTLEKTTASIELYKWVNFAIIIAGLILVLGSAIYAMVTKKPNIEAIAFGGVGFAGIIASLITNPISSIGRTSRQMVQLQISYFGFLKQIDILKNTKANDIDDMEKKSKRLEEVICSLQESLCNHFDSPKEDKRENNKNKEDKE